MSHVVAQHQSPKLIPFLAVPNSNHHVCAFVPTLPYLLTYRY
jgi:hypothetical protein